MYTQAYVHVYTHICPHMYEVNHKVIHSVLNNTSLGVQYRGTFLERTDFRFSECDITENMLLSLEKLNSNQPVSLLSLFWFYFKISTPEIVIGYDVTHC